MHRQCHFLFLLLCFSVSINSVTSLSSDGLALLSLLNHWTSVPEPISSSWILSDSTPCKWVGVECDPALHVFALNVSSYDIYGQLGPEIGNLSRLQTLVLSFNNFSGQIPLELASCSLLETLDLSGNGFSGKVPDNLHELRSLQYLRLSDNFLEGQIPSSIGNCSQLVELDLSFNQLSGVLPESLNNLKNLSIIQVRDNSLEGSISFGSENCKNLVFLDLSSNNFSGSLPSALGNCTGLEEFSAAVNQLVAPIPSSFGLLDKLQLLYLPENQLSGKIPPELGNCKSLTGLQLYTNQLVGEIPDELGMLTSLEDLELFQNNLTGEIPVSIWRIQTLQYVHLYMNNLTGELPIEMIELKQLKRITLYNNQFYGGVPKALGINSSLEQIDFMYNRFNGSIPSSLCHGKQLMVLNMGFNQFQGPIPSDVGSCSTLWRLRLQQNNLIGVLPQFVKNSNLSLMDISSNKISGEIPSSLGNCRNLTTINLSMNKLTGVIPEELGHLADLQALDLSHNRLVGALPTSLSNCTKMQQFDVGSNLLNGSIPSSLGSWIGLSKLVLSENRFTGGIPPFLSEYEKLLELQLGGNMFGGVIPSSIGALQNLRYALNLSSSALTGEVPSEIGKLIMLQQLDLSHNNLTGSLRVLDGMKSLIEVNVSFNSFTGAVPVTLMNLLNSSSFSFSSNPSLCVSYLPSCGFTCAGNNTIKLCNSPSSKPKGLSKVGIAFIALGSSILVVSLLYLLVFLFCLSRRTKQELGVSAREGPTSLLSKALEATENLNDRYIIGRGTHGTVYRASLSEDKDFAVKKLVFAGHEGRRLSMIRELQTLGKIKHRNLIKLEDFWLGKDYGLILYRYMQNGSLHDALHETTPPLILEWSVRYKIALSTAYALEYLHYDCDPTIVHRDIKPMNILLDSEMEAHIADFGIAKLLDQSTPSTMSISVVGTTGYIAPENAFSTENSVESDVYSYGVVLLELITRKKALDPSFMEQTHIVGWVRSLWLDTGKIDGIVDSSLAEEILDSNIRDRIGYLLLVALSCTHSDPKNRPTMRDITKKLLDVTSPMRSTNF
ncbi:receptor-like protein kinase isoform X2 [Argentina anserina]|uniref:receptor-like protein kinase isoform X2 n=1 Tax=Argentina anserina TaxID=57926 RepID=UPI00217686E7|nr:receptor-like protein kinase isoform X2 [Potentilla anserina]